MGPNLVRAAGWALASVFFAFDAPGHELLAEPPRTSLVLEARVKSVANEAGIGTVVFEVEHARRGRVDSPLTLRYHVGPSGDGSLLAVAGSTPSAVFPTVSLFRPGEPVLLCVDLAGGAPGDLWRIGRFRMAGEPLPIVLADRMLNGNLEAFLPSR